MESKPVRVLFVCLGNICRSPMAEAVFANKVHQAGLDDRISADSAGTDAWHVGSEPHPGTRRLLRDLGISYTHTARTVKPQDFDDFDYILAMDSDNIARLDQIGAGSANVKLFLTYAPDCQETSVPDPYYTGNFEQVHELVDAASIGLLETIRREHQI